MELALITANLVSGIGCAIPLSVLLRRLYGKPVSVFRCFAILLGVYLAESVAVAMGMGIPVFSVALAGVWGIVFGRWLRRRMSPDKVLKTAFFLSLYSSLPAASFILVPVVAWVDGWHILSAEEGARFGIPGFPYVPWPLETILVFYAALVAGAIVLKPAITMSEVRWLIRPGAKSVVGGR